MATKARRHEGIFGTRWNAALPIFVAWCLGGTDAGAQDLLDGARLRVVNAPLARIKLGLSNEFIIHLGTNAVYVAAGAGITITTNGTGSNVTYTVSSSAGGTNTLWMTNAAALGSAGTVVWDTGVTGYLAGAVAHLGVNVSGGAGGAPGGAVAHLQVNMGGAFVGSTNVFMNVTNGTLGIGVNTPQATLHLSNNFVGGFAPVVFMQASSGGVMGLFGWRVTGGAAEPSFGTESTSQQIEWILRAQGAQAAIVSSNGLFPQISLASSKYLGQRDRMWGSNVAYHVWANDTLATAGALLVGANNAASITNVLAASATLDFPSTSLGAVADLPITCAGAEDGDVVSVGPPVGSARPMLGEYSGFASNGVVYVRFTPSAMTQDPASGTFKVLVTKF